MVHRDRQGVGASAIGSNANGNDLKFERTHDRSLKRPLKNGRDCGGSISSVGFILCGELRWLQNLWRSLNLLLWLGPKTLSRYAIKSDRRAGFASMVKI
jgi:hypothetical protein